MAIRKPLLPRKSVFLDDCQPALHLQKAPLCRSPRTAFGNPLSFQPQSSGHIGLNESL